MQRFSLFANILVPVSLLHGDSSGSAAAEGGGGVINKVFLLPRGMGGFANRTSGKGRRLIISFAENTLIRRLCNPLMNNQWTTYSWNVGMRKYTRKKLMVSLITKAISVYL